MKKGNKLLRTGGILLVLTLITSCFVGGTFAKYVTKDEGSDTARVARWGVEVAVETAVEDLFEGSYSKNFSGLSLSSNTVQTETTMDVFAPGTRGELGKTEITGTPEVTVQVTTEATVKMENWMIDVGGSNGEEFYCPLIFTISGTKADGTQVEYTIEGLNYAEDANGGMGGLITELQNKIQDTYKGTFEAGTDLEEKLTDFSITWEWPFAGQDEDDDYSDNGTWTVQDGQTNEKDTALADLAYAQGWFDEDDAPTITITLKTTVSQVD